jgi:hypothetical protein
MTTIVLLLMLSQAEKPSAPPPPSSVAASSFPAALGRASFAIDLTTLTGIDLEVHAIPYVMLEGEVGTDQSTWDRVPWAVRAGPSGLILSLRNARQEGFSVRGSFLAGYASARVGRGLSIQARVDATLWAGQHFGVSIGLNGGFLIVGEPGSWSPWRPDAGLNLGLSF